MDTLIRLLLSHLRDFLRSRLSLQLEVLVLRHQLEVYQRVSGRPRIQPVDRVFWSLLSKQWRGWRETLVIVRPETVIRWRRRRFRDHWRRLSRRSKCGRPPIPADLRVLIRRMSRVNPLWEAPRITAELAKLGIDIAQSTVEKCRTRPRRPSSPSWQSFLRSHLNEMIAVDFLVVPTVRHRVLYVFLVLSLSRRRVVHFNVTPNPTANWAAQQLVEAFPWERSPRYLQRDRDAIYGERFQERVRSLGFEQILSAPRSPWQNAYVERLVGTIRRECLDHVVVLNERHLKRVLRRYVGYYHRWRPHQGLEMDSPAGRARQAPGAGPVVEVREVFGLHHHYERRAA